MSERFDIVFYGILQPGTDRKAAQAAMAKLFKTTPEKVKSYFSGQRRVIKSQVDDLTAEKYRLTLERIGLTIKLETTDSLPPATTGSTRVGQGPPETEIDTGDISMAEVGANVIEHPQPVTPAPIGDISNISLAEVGAHVIEHPQPMTPVLIGDISDISLAEVGAHVIEHPQPVTAAPILDTSDISIADIGADLLEHPPEKKAASLPDISRLTLVKDH